MVIVYFFPFAGDNIDKLREQEELHHSKKGQMFFGILDGPNVLLNYLKPTDRLYIVAHGNPWVIAQNQTSESTLSAFELAKLMVAKRLPKNFIDIRILACDSGINASKYSCSFAQRFKERMSELGYNKLEVTGYLGGVFLSRNWRLENNEKSGFHQGKKKGIIPDESFSHMIKSRLGIDRTLKYAASDFKKVF
ncbi:hypothetical protein ACSC77_004055 [Escherichia coli]|uniref:hypothetical protein n=1 Tax=Escherichia coli TaxID=562 RepID=UPI00202150E3|nr:hypothetical protein [Escherichia coli]MDA6825546.1 hypothetical protein [Escherichia coli]MDO2886148.1 hypothetical protein [Escherichia coli]